MVIETSGSFVALKRIFVRFESMLNNYVTTSRLNVLTP